MVSNVAKNLGNNIKTKPPLVVFTICLMGIVVTTLCLAYYVHTKDRILNTDVKQEWLSILKHFNKMTVCLEKNSNPQSLQKNEKTSSISTKITLNVEKLKEPVNVQGYIPLAGWVNNCPNDVAIPEYFHISFSVQNPNNTKDICATLTGPPTFIPKLLNERKICEPGLIQGAKWETISAVVEPEDSFCVNGMKGKLVYNMEAYKGVKFDAMLSVEDRLTINYHLILTSGVLLVVVICITVYALCGKKHTHTGDSTQYLMARNI